MSSPLSAETLSKFTVSKTFQSTDPDACITSLDFDDSGQFLISTLTNESINLYDASKGAFVKPIYSKKYGCHLAKFTHQQKNCVYASTKEDNTIRYLSLNDNSYIRYFKGHKGLVNSLEVSPIQDVFCSASIDDTVKLWDIRTSSFQASIPAERPSFVSFDPAGIVLAVGSETTGTVELRDIKQFAAMPFITFQLPKSFKYNKIEFSNDNKYILLSSLNNNHLILDAFEGFIVTQLGDTQPIPIRAWPDSGSACFSPDGRFVFAGNGDGRLYLYDLKTEKDKKLPPVLQPTARLVGDTKPRMCAFNPKLLELVTADSQLVSVLIRREILRSILTSNI